MKARRHLLFALSVFLIILCLVGLIYPQAFVRAAPNADPAVEAQLVDRFGGHGKVVTFQDNYPNFQDSYAYVGIGTRLAVVDLTTPTEDMAPRGLTEPLPNLIIDAYVDGGNAYLAVQSYGLAVIGTNFIPPAEPPVLARVPLAIPGSPTGVTEKDGYVYLACGLGGLQVVDTNVLDDIHVETPDPPITGISARQVTFFPEIAKTYLIVSANEDGLYIFSLSDPANPLQVGHLAIGELGFDGVLDVAVRDQYAYVIGAPAWFRMVDLINPSDPIPLDSGPLDIIFQGFRVAVSMDGNFAYVANSEAGTQIILTTNKDAPELSIAFGHRADFAKSVVVKPLTADESEPGWILTAGGSSGLHIYDESLCRISRGDCEELGYYDPGGLPSDFKIRDEILVTTGWPSNSYRHYDITNPGKPDQMVFTVGFKERKFTSPFPEMEATYIAFSGTDAYLVGSSQLRKLNFADPTNPQEVFSDSAFNNGILAAWNEQIFFTPNETHGVRGGPGGIVQLQESGGGGEFEIVRALYSGTVRDMQVVGNFLYAAAGPQGLRVFDLSNPTPALPGIELPGGDARRVAISGSRAYVADGSGGLRILDITDPDSISELGFYAPAGWEAQAVAARGDLAFVLDGQDSLQIIDASTPASPLLVGAYDALFSPLGIAVAGDYIYIADDKAGLVVLYFVPPVVQTISDQGGQIVSPVTQATCDFPAGAFNEDVTVTFVPRLDNPATLGWQLTGANRAFEINAVNAGGQPVQPANSYSITIQYDPAQLGGFPEDQLALYYWDGQAWVKEPTSQVNTTTKTITATPNHFSSWTTASSMIQVLVPMVRR